MCLLSVKMEVQPPTSSASRRLHVACLRPPQYNGQRHLEPRVAIMRQSTTVVVVSASIPRCRSQHYELATQMSRCIFTHSHISRFVSPPTQSNGDQSSHYDLRSNAKFVWISLVDLLKASRTTSWVYLERATWSVVFRREWHDRNDRHASRRDSTEEVFIRCSKLSLCRCYRSSTKPSIAGSTL